MNPFVRNVLAVLAGLVIGSIVNGSLIGLGASIFPPPDGVNPNDISSIKENIHLYTPKHFISPFLAHALGTLTGAFLTARLAVSNHRNLTMIIPCFFLLGGIAAIAMLPSPMWFNIVDLVFAYFPMGLLGYWLAGFGRAT